eukprot:6172771-Pleurochrysis_carterae.AAC.2
MRGEPSRSEREARVPHCRVKVRNEGQCALKGQVCGHHKEKPKVRKAEKQNLAEAPHKSGKQKEAEKTVLAGESKSRWFARVGERKRRSSTAPAACSREVPWRR